MKLTLENLLNWGSLDVAFLETLMTNLEIYEVEEVDSINQLMKRSEVVIATSRVEGLIKFGMVRKDQVILCLSKPEPEIKPEIAMKAGARYAGDGRLVSHILALPGLVKGTLDARASKVSIEMMIAAAEKIADLAKQGEILPNVLDKNLHCEVAKVVRTVAVETGIANLDVIEIEEEDEENPDDVFKNIRQINDWMSN